MFLERSVCLNYVLLHYLYRSQTSNLFLFIAFFSKPQAYLQMWNNFNDSNVVFTNHWEMCSWTGRSQCDLKCCLNKEGFLHHFLHGSGHSSWPSDQPPPPCCASVYTPAISWNKHWEIVKKTFPQEKQTPFQNGQQEHEKRNFIAEGHWRIVGGTGFSFHSAFMQDCPQLTTYAIYSHGLFVQTASWLLAFKSLLH